MQEQVDRVRLGQCSEWLVPRSPQIIHRLPKERGDQWKAVGVASMEKSGSYLESRAEEWVWRAGLEKDEELGWGGQNQRGQLFSETKKQD